MQIERLPNNWLFERHPKQQIMAWVAQLRYFYYKRAWGGHANDGDEFQVAFSYSDRKDLTHRLGQLGLTLATIPEDFPRPVIGQAYSGIEFERFKSEIERYPDVEQPGHTKIFGRKVFIWVHANSIHIAVSGTKDNNSYEVSEDDFRVCLDLENHFDSLGWDVIKDNSLEKSACCISHARYPELYKEETTGPNST